MKSLAQKSKKRGWYVYMLECSDGSIYTGIAVDVQKRFKEHAKGTGGRYTRSHEPVRILYIEKQKTRSAALKREAEIKRLSKKKKVLLIDSVGH